MDKMCSELRQIVNIERFPKEQRPENRLSDCIVGVMPRPLLMEIMRCIFTRTNFGVLVLQRLWLSNQRQPIFRYLQI